MHISLALLTMIFQVGNQTEQDSKSFTTGQTWGALRKAWKGYKIAKVQGDRAKMTEYATKIRKLEGELGVPQASFPDLSLN
ncbi:MAG: hypothetical protein QXU32_10785 [Nitrososphaerales archaeon]